MALKLRLKTFYTTLLLATILLFQSCGAYYKSSIPIDEAVQRSKKVKVTTRDGDTFKLRRIELEGDQYYGIRKSGKRVELDAGQLARIRPFNTKKAIVLNVLLAGTIVMTILTVVVFQGVAKAAGELSTP